MSRRATPYLTGEEQLRLARGQPLDGESDGFPLLSSGKPSLNASGYHNHSVATADAAPPAFSGRSAAASAAATESDGDHQSKPSTSNQAPQQPVNECVVQRRERRKRIREATKSSNAVEGSRSHSGLECGHEARSIFVVNLNKKNKDSDIRDYIEEGGITALKIR